PDNFHPQMTAEFFQPSKWVWTNADFPSMSWHDCRLHGLAIIDDFDPHLHELRLDLDYILKWSGFGDDTGEPGFWISPATLVFYAGKFQIGIENALGTWIISVECRSLDSPDSQEWIVHLNSGHQITVESSGFHQYLRRAPVFVPTPAQSLQFSQRGGIS